MLARSSVGGRPWEKATSAGPSGDSEGPSCYLSEQPLHHTRGQKPGQPDSEQHITFIKSAGVCLIREKARQTRHESESPPHLVESTWLVSDLLRLHSSSVKEDMYHH